MSSENERMVRRQMNGGGWVYTLGFGVPATLVILAGFQSWAPARVLFDDLPSTAGLHPLTGGIGYAADMVWFAAAAICLFAATVAARGLERQFLVYGGILTAALALDDFFMVHDYLLPSVGMAERYPKAVYVLAALTYLARFHPLIRRAKWPALMAAGGCLAGSLVFDSPMTAKLFHSLPHDFAFHVIEDGLKITGIFLWSFFQMYTASQLVRGSLPASRPSLVSAGFATLSQGRRTG